jgi:hypothetical protein
MCKGGLSKAEGVREFLIAVKGSRGKHTKYMRPPLQLECDEKGSRAKHAKFIGVSHLPRLRVGELENGLPRILIVKPE